MHELFTSVGLRLDLIVLFSVGVGGVLLLAIGLALFFIVDWEGPGIILATIAGGVLLIGGGGWVASLIPFDTKYHHVYAYDTTVESVSNVLAEDGGDLTRQPIVSTPDGVNLLVEDARVVNMVGETVDFRCTVEWVPYGADRYNCWIGDTK